MPKSKQKIKVIVLNPPITEEERNHWREKCTQAAVRAINADIDKDFEGFYERVCGKK
ncbi:MAG: hypothetical protein LBM16_01560 [Clostridiales bacterium]|nr:hypothetical protein [Clostridiales bacterium]